MNANSQWSDCRKIAGNWRKTVRLDHFPLERSSSIRQTKMTQNELNDFLQGLIRNKFIQSTSAQSTQQTSVFNHQKCSEKLDKNEKICKIFKQSLSRSSEAVMTIESIPSTAKNNGNSTSLNSMDESRKNNQEYGLLERVEGLKFRLQERRKLLSNLDLNGLTLSDIIDFALCLNDLIIERKIELDNSIIKLSEDETFKIENKNIIVIEGLIR